MNFILKLKHWQIFILLIVASTASNFTWVNHETFNLALNLFGILIYFFWYFAVGLELTEHLPPRIELPRTMFVINAFVIIISIIVVVTLFNGQFSNSGVIGFMWIVYLMYAIFQFMFYPSKVLKTLELSKEATFGQYFGYFLLTLFWPLGIWWIQPKLNALMLKSN